MAKYRLVAMDMDSTLIQAECIDEMARVAGVGDQVSEITRRAMLGELDFEQALRERMALLKGLDEPAIQEVYDAIELTPGAEILCRTLKRSGVVLAICSGGFTWFAERFANRLGIDHVLANGLSWSGGKLDGELLPPVVDATAKAARLLQLADLYGIPIHQTAAIGDGANDLPLMKAAGLGIAFRAKPVVREEADAHIDEGGLDEALKLLGFA